MTSSKDSSEASKFYHACETGDVDFIRNYLRKLSATRLNPNHFESSVKSTPLHAACFNGHKDIVQLLIQYGCDRYQKDGDGRTAYEVAANDEIRQLFKRPTNHEHTPRFQEENIHHLFEFVKRPEEANEESTNLVDKLQSKQHKTPSIQGYNTDAEKKVEVGYATTSIAMCQSKLGRFIADKFHDGAPMSLESMGRRLQEIIDKEITDSDDRQLQKAHELLKNFVQGSDEDHVNHLIRLYTLETNFYRILKRDPIPLALPLYVTLEKLKHRFFQGQSYRGARMNDEEISIYEWASHDHERVVQSIHFASTSLILSVAEQFATKNTDKKKNDERKSVLFIYNFPKKCEQAINLSRISNSDACLSEFEDEAEVLILPWTLFQVDYVKKESLPSSLSSYTIHLSNILLPHKGIWSSLKWILKHPKGSLHRFREHFPDKPPENQPDGIVKQLMRNFRVSDDNISNEEN